jgi:transcriptional regulator with XRE-family HTH domain
MDIAELRLVSLAREQAASGIARELRIRRGLSVREVADAAGVTPAAVWRWERGERVPRTAVAARYGALLVELAGTSAGTPA